MSEQEVNFRSKGAELAGTLSHPDSGGPFPALLLLPGSGQTDRNDNVKQFPINALAEVAADLLAHGFASLRYDKRGVGQSGGDYWATGFNDRYEDARAALQFLTEQSSIQPKKVFVLGHSEGALLATRLAGGGADIAGIILLAGPAQSGEAVLKWQGREITKGLKGPSGWLIRTFHIDVTKSQQKKLDRIKATKKDWYRQLFVKVNAKWLREFMAYDPAADFSRLKVPVLAITGSKDIQVDPADLTRMERLVKAPFESHLIPDMTHLLRVDTGEATITKYKQEVKRPIAYKVLEIIQLWLGKQIATGKTS
jgi:hypothetical protein